MRHRVLIGAVQTAAFVGGGVLLPAVHLAWHPANHSHGPGGSVGASERTAPLERTGAAPHAHPHPHPHSPQAPDDTSARPAAAPRPDDASRGPTEARPPAPLGHGHGSLAHLDAALLSAPAPLALPAPGLIQILTPAGHVRVVALFHASLPRPRPPPAVAAS